MKKQDLIDRHQPENETEHDAVNRVWEMCGGFAECAECKEKCADCQLLDFQYESEIEKMSE